MPGSYLLEHGCCLSQSLSHLSACLSTNKLLMVIYTTVSSLCHELTESNVLLCFLHYVLVKILILHFPFCLASLLIISLSPLLLFFPSVLSSSPFTQSLSSCFYNNNNYHGKRLNMGMMLVIFMIRMLLLLLWQLMMMIVEIALI